MSNEVDVRTVGWGTSCEYMLHVEHYYEDDGGNMRSYTESEGRLRCRLEMVNAKLDKCKTCGKLLRYP